MVFAPFASAQCRIHHRVTQVEIHAFWGLSNPDNRLSFFEGKASLRPRGGCGLLSLKTPQEQHHPKEV